MLYYQIFEQIRQHQINFIVKILILSTVILNSADYLITPILAVFITEKLNAGVEVVGITFAIFLIARSIIELPIASWIDSTKSEKDDLAVLIWGNIIYGLGYIAMIFITQVIHLYLIHIVLGIASAFSYAGWNSLFTSHINHEKKAMEWSVVDIALNLGIAASAALGGFLAKMWGFSILFGVVGTLMIIGGCSLFLLKNKIQ